MFVISGFRSVTVGTDTFIYEEKYSSFLLHYNSILDVWTEKEPLFYSIFYLLNIWGLSFRWVLLVNSILFLAPIGYIVFKNNDIGAKSLLFLLLLGLYFFEFNGMRQAIAMSFVLAGCFCLERNNINSFLLCTAIAFGFHQSSIVALALPLLKIIKFDKAVFLTLLYISYLLPQVFDFMPYISRMTVLFGDYADYTHYLDEIHNIGRIPIVGTIQTLLFTYIILRNEDKESKTDFFFKASLFCVIMQNLLYVSPQWSSRIILYYEMAMIIYFAKLSNRSVQDAIIVYIYAYAKFFYYSLYLGTNEILPYEFNLY